MKGDGLRPVAVREKHERARQAAAGAGNCGENFERADRGNSGELAVLRNRQKVREQQEYSGYGGNPRGGFGRAKLHGLSVRNWHYDKNGGARIQAPPFFTGLEQRF